MFLKCILVDLLLGEERTKDFGEIELFVFFTRVFSLECMCVFFPHLEKGSVGKLKLSNLLEALDKIMH